VIQKCKGGSWPGAPPARKTQIYLVKLPVTDHHSEFSKSLRFFFLAVAFPRGTVYSYLLVKNLLWFAMVAAVLGLINATSTPSEQEAMLQFVSTFQYCKDPSWSAETPLCTPVFGGGLTMTKPICTPLFL
jgi:hypothetical protein